MTCKVVTVITSQIYHRNKVMRILSCDGLTVLSPLSPKIDQHQKSPGSTYALENGAVVRIRDMITQIL